jgi:hypothetical protein
MRMARMFARCCVGAAGLLSLASCGDPADPAGQGAVTVHITQQPGLVCTPQPHYANIPMNAAGGQQVSATVAPKPAVDGEENMRVQCTVAPQGGKFKVHADLTSPGATANAAVTNIILDTVIGVGEDKAPGSLALFDDQSGARFVSSTCTYSVKPNGDSLAIDAGKAWGSFTCTSLTDPGNPGSGCAVDRGFFLLGNCSQ